MTLTWMHQKATSKTSLMLMVKNVLRRRRKPSGRETQRKLSEPPSETSSEPSERRPSAGESKRKPKGKLGQKHGKRSA
jgi:hypothetical protein